MQRKFIFLINPISGAARRSGLREMIARKCDARNIPFLILPTERDGRYEHVKEKIREERFTDVIVCGGDGTVSAVAGDLLKIDVSIGIIPLGSGNGLALTAGIPVSAARALDIIFQGKSGWVDGFLINNRFSCMLCGIGFDAQVAHDFAQSKRRGLQTYMKISAVNYFKAPAYSFTIESGEKTFKTEAFFISIANSNQFGNNFTIAPRASLSDGLFDVVIVNRMNKFMLPFSILQQLTGINGLQKPDDHIDRKNIIYFQASAITIHNHGLAPLHIDGDPGKTAEILNVRILPNAFRLLHPVTL